MTNIHARPDKHMKMMQTGQSIQVHVSAPQSSSVTPGEVRVQFWNKQERMMRALKLGGMCWGAAVVAVLIPLLHFILVPCFFLAGPIMAFIAIGQESVILGGEGKCPNCGQFLPIARAAYRFPISDLCSSCQSSLKIERADSQAT